MTAENMLRRALQLHRSGHLGDAASLYRDVLRQQPNNVDALNLLAVILSGSGFHAEAAIFLQQAIRTDPNFFVLHVNLGNALQALGRIDEAIAAFGRADALSPDNAQILNNLGSALNAKGRFNDAALVCARVVEMAPGFREGVVNLGNALAGQGNVAGAEACYRNAIELAPGEGGAYYNLGTLLQSAGRLAEAIEVHNQAVTIDPSDAIKHYNLANALTDADRYDDALSQYREVLRLNPRFVDGWVNLGAAQMLSAKPDEAASSYRAALTFDPDAGDIHWNLALALIAGGEFAEGWEEYEWRWRNPHFTSPQRVFASPLWDGGALDGQTLLLHAEQGFGDTILAARYAPLAAAQGARVVVECPKTLVRLFGTLTGVSQVVARGDDLPPFDCHAPMMSLPHLFGTTLGTIPAHTPYLAVPDGVAAPAVLAEASGRKVGLCWAGSATRRDDRRRSLAWETLAPLLDTRGASFFSLQVGDRALDLAKSAEARIADLAPKIVDLAPQIGDFADTAACIASCDLVISVDTAVAHLAGALGKPVWVMQPFAPSHLYPYGRDDMPWYPTMRQFRCAAPGAWDDVVTRIGHALQQLG